MGHQFRFRGEKVVTGEVEHFAAVLPTACFLPRPADLFPLPKDAGAAPELTVA